jgi:hypothetical protein
MNFHTTCSSALSERQMLPPWTMSENTEKLQFSLTNHLPEFLMLIYTFRRVSQESVLENWEIKE